MLPAIIMPPPRIKSDRRKIFPIFLMCLCVMVYFLIWLLDDSGGPLVIYFESDVIPPKMNITDGNITLATTKTYSIKFFK